MPGKVREEAFEAGTIMRGDGSAAVSPCGDISNRMSSEVKPKTATTVVMLCEHLDRFSSSSTISKQLPYSSSFEKSGLVNHVAFKASPKDGGNFP